MALFSLSKLSLWNSSSRCCPTQKTMGVVYLCLIVLLGQTKYSTSSKVIRFNTHDRNSTYLSKGVETLRSTFFQNQPSTSNSNSAELLLFENGKRVGNGAEEFNKEPEYADHLLSSSERSRISYESKTPKDFSGSFERNYTASRKSPVSDEQFQEFIRNIGNLTEETKQLLLQEKINLEKGIYQVFRFVPTTLKELSFLSDLQANSTKYDIDFWKSPRGLGQLVDVMVPPSYQKTLKDILWNENIDFNIIIEDVEQKIFEHEKKSRLSDFGRSRRRDSRSRSFYDFRQYQSYETMRRYMRSVEFAFPHLAKVYTIGRTHEGRPIEVMKIGNPVTDDTKRIIWLDGGTHAREWATPHVATYFIYVLTTKYGRDPGITNYVDSLTFFIAPNLNPDGYEYSRTATHPVVRLWRKNRSPSVCPQGNLCCSGVDLNRNFDVEWGKVGTSHHPCSGIYGGVGPFSEPESRAVRDVVWGRKHLIDAFITFHTYAQMWTHGYGYIKGQYPFDVHDLYRVGQNAAANIAQVYGTEFQVGGSADLLYATSGGSDDWAKEKAGVKYVYLVELRPDINQKDGFILPEIQLLPTAQETWAGVTAVVDAVLQRNSVPRKWTCKQQKGWGWCGSSFMNGYCRRSCGQCIGGITEPCTDKAPLGPYTCAHYKQWNLCTQPFMYGFCEVTCGTCQRRAGAIGGFNTGGLVAQLGSGGRNPSFRGSGRVRNGRRFFQTRRLPQSSRFFARPPISDKKNKQAKS